MIDNSSSKPLLPLSLLYGGEASSKRTIGAGLARASRKWLSSFHMLSNLSVTCYFCSYVTFSAALLPMNTLGLRTQTFKASLVEGKDRTELAGVRGAHFRR